MNYVVHFQKIGTIGRAVSPRLRREVRVEAVDADAAEAIASREFFDRTFRIIRVEEETA